MEAAAWCRSQFWDPYSPAPYWGQPLLEKVANLGQVLVLDLHLLPLVMHRPFSGHLGEEEKSGEKKKAEHPTRDPRFKI